MDNSGLNLLGKPIVQVDAKSIGSRELIASEVEAVLGTGASGYNYLDNGGFAENRWSRGSTSISCPTGIKTFRADEWWCQPSGAAVTYERVTGFDAICLFAAKLTGATGVTTVDFGQNIPRTMSWPLQSDQLLLSFSIFNETGASLQPTVLINTANLPNDFSAVTNQLTQAPTQTGANGTVQQYTLSFPGDGPSNIQNGLQVVIRLPNGAMSSGAKFVTIGEIKLELTENTTPSQFVVQREPNESTGGTVANAPYNLLVNGQFTRFLYPGTSPVVSAGIDTANAEGWWVAAAGGSTATLTQLAGGPANNLTAYAQRITGGSGVNAVDFGQNFGPGAAGALRRNMMLTLWMRYTDGAADSVTPTLNIGTPGSPSAWGSVTPQITAALAPCADGVWTEQTFQFDGSTLTGTANGIRLWIEFPSGSMDAATKKIDIAQALLEEGVTASTFKPYLERGPLSVARAEGLRGQSQQSVSTVSQAQFTANEVTLRKKTGEIETAFGVSVSLDMTTGGAGGLDTGSAAVGWYDVYLIGNGSNVAALATLAAVSLFASPAVPLIPNGYYAAVRISRIYVTSIGPVVLRPFVQTGDTFAVPVVNLYNATPGGTYVSVATSTGAPPDAKRISGTFGRTDAGACRASIACNSGALGEQTFNMGDGGATFNSIRTAGHFEINLLPQATPALFVKGDTSQNIRLDVTGFTI